MSATLSFTSCSRVSVVPVTARPMVKAQAKAGNWLPGWNSPAHLDGSLPGDYGFDPLGLGEEVLPRMREAEIINGRWAMLAVAGCLAVEVLGLGDWYTAPMWALKEGASATYFGVTVPFDIKTLILVELVAMAGVELLRNEEKDAVKRIYPGGAFDPVGLAKEGTNVEAARTKEVKNGRLAMMAFVGFVGQHAATGKSPLEALSAHLSNPGANNFATNGVSLPATAFPFLY